MEVFETLSRTPALLARVAAQVPDALVRVRSGLFALVEHAWHIADLEREGFGERVRRLIAEEDLFLPDFDGSEGTVAKNPLSTYGQPGSWLKLKTYETVEQDRDKNESDTLAYVESIEDSVRASVGSENPALTQFGMTPKRPRTKRPAADIAASTKKAKK